MKIEIKKINEWNMLEIQKLLNSVDLELVCTNQNPGICEIVICNKKLQVSKVALNIDELRQINSSPYKYVKSLILNKKLEMEYLW